MFGNQSYKRTKIGNSDLVLLPQFIRFDKVCLCYDSFWPKFKAAQIEESVVNCLQLLKNSLNDSSSIYFACSINQDFHSGGFMCHSQYLDHLRDKLMPFLDSSHAYEFKIDFYSDWDSDKIVIAQLLQILLPNNCSNVRIDFSYFGLGRPMFSAHPHHTQLPVEAISAWLHRRNSNAGVQNNRKNHRKSHFQIEVDCIENTEEMCDDLKTVGICFKIANFNSNFRVESLL